ncbi:MULTISPECIES: CDP-glycerol glycerophosphotransferase family protein [Bacillus]|uniref:CDP-glycerol--glycerophosphate glycerophosphotransferase n=1 Tax=Bacillus pumilus (strain SAFR-032) TaxID=315750 RepID=A8FI20_BACP2|nr:CDP-glycerol glycerophosphotransferase family protein [Bacillus pumilus]ABV63887.1 CDP-glycerol--glycerophosphate glycerophosphotransferase [Bacillus pumilus SAFR-032]MBC3641351.1 CDP-glycerol glycerophosphotransferase family protein [Bacillus pumilus]MBC3646979.1 CDP-glycerol glycerophosphotransferase family protein [Bacillus pumilus]MBC3648327.1 CDP-glycerol glycerophosphotransferase family protein [Bacillus pumilus]MBC3652287.1 CDP-glycerol glycerophosphotransferase family protein [Bacil
MNKKILKRNKKILKRKINFLKDPLRNFIKDKRHQRNNLYAYYYQHLEVVDKTVFYESRDGKSMTDSPLAIFEYLLHQPNFKDYTHIWAIEDFETLKPILNKYKDDKNVIFVKRNSKDYLKYLATAKYLINNSTFQPFFICKEEQVYINTWHGTPLKYMGFDIPGNPAHSQNVLRNFLSSDYLISPNEHTTSMFLNSYKLKHIFPGKIVEEGYPRIDLTLNSDSNAFKKSLQSFGVSLSLEKKTIVYAPTWKGTNVGKVKNNLTQITSDLNYLQEKCGKEYNILLKLHPFLYHQASRSTELQGRLIPDFIDTNVLLCATDLLITDYSSIFFDFLVTNKPILFYMWDADEYTEERGMYFKLEDLPGPRVYNIRDLAKSISEIKEISTQFKTQYDQFKHEFTKHDDGKVTERVVNTIFNKVTENIRCINTHNNKKEKILIYPGGMKNNGITSSFINLTQNIDYDKYDVSCYMSTPNSKEVLNNIAKVNKNVRFIFKPGLPVYTLQEVYKDKLIHNRGVKGKLEKRLYPKDAYSREFKRLFGKSTFDHVIDFSGYSLYWAKYLVSADAKTKICFMHNDLLSDSERTINGKKPHRINLRGLFTIYHKFDKLVSVSKGTMDLNKQNLSHYADESKFDYVMNSINPDKILGTDSPISEKDSNSLIVSNKAFNSRARIISSKHDKIFTTLVENHPSTFSSKEFENKVVMVTRKAVTNQNEVLYKFTYEDHVVGWLNKEAFKLLPDSILCEEKVHKLAVVTSPKRNDIWTKPYKTKGIKKVSSSYPYKNIMVEIDREARTERSSYSRFYVNKQLIGWIDSSALKILKEYELISNLSEEKQALIEKEKHTLLSENYHVHEEFIRSLNNRTFLERNLNKQMKIVHTENHKIWSKAYPNFGYTEVCSADLYKDLIVTVTKSHKTNTSTYYQFSYDGQVIGWLNVKAFKQLDHQTILSRKEVSYSALLHLNDYKIFNKTNENTRYEVIEDYYQYNQKEFIVTEEVTTPISTYCTIELDNEKIGWVDKKTLEIIRFRGFQIGKEFVPYPSKQHYNFVNMGRLSPEKGQDNLITAFKQHVETNPNSKLYILGDGPLKKDLQMLVDQFELQNHVFLVGQVENPFTVLKMCDCFVLSSHYEGQPMVLLEAMTLGMDILATDIIANRTVLEDGKYGALVDNSIDGLIQGLNNFSSHTHPAYAPFDYKEYNKKAMDTFYKVLN